MSLQDLLVWTSPAQTGVLELLSICMPESRKLDIKHQEQRDTYWCGPACLSMIGQYYGAPISQRRIADYVFRDGISRTRDLARFSQRFLGLNAWIVVKSGLATVRHFINRGLAPIALQRLDMTGDRGHFRVVTCFEKGGLTLQDPMLGANLFCPFHEFSALWQANKQTIDSGVLLVLAPSRGPSSVGPFPAHLPGTLLPA